MTRLLIAFISLALVSCASKQPVVPAVPSWDVVPLEVVEALCSRLKMDAVATGRLTIVEVTQPLATPRSLAAVRSATPGRHQGASGPAQVVHHALPLTLEGSSCQWKPVESRASAGSDEMVVELSAPLSNPYLPSEAGMFVRVGLGGHHESWYWISLMTNGKAWGVRFVSVLPY